MYYCAPLLQCSVPFQKFSHMQNTELILQHLIINIALIFPQSYTKNPSSTALLYIYKK